MSRISPRSVHGYHLVADQTTTWRLQSTSDEGRNMPGVVSARASGGRAMVEQSRSRGRAEAWRPWIAAGRRPALAWAQGLTDFARRAAPRVREWAGAEVAPGRLGPMLAVAFRRGATSHFAAAARLAAWVAAPRL